MLYLNLLHRLHARQVPVPGSQLLLLLDGDRDKSRAIPRVVLGHVGAVGVPGGDVGVLPVNLGSTDVPVNITLLRCHVSGNISPARPSLPHDQDQPGQPTNLGPQWPPPPHRQGWSRSSTAQQSWALPRNHPKDLSFKVRTDLKGVPSTLYLFFTVFKSFNPAESGHLRSKEETAKMAIVDPTQGACLT